MALAGAMPSLAQAAPLPGFDTRRQRIFRAAVEAYDGEGPIMSAGRDLVVEMAARYDASQDLFFKVWIDALLDALDSAPDGARFADRDVASRRAVLLEWSRASEPADALLNRARPNDASEPDDLTAANAATTDACAAQLASLPADALDLDPVTGLPNYLPPTPSWPDIGDGTGAVGTPVRLRRDLLCSSYALIASFFVDDTRYLTPEAFA